MRTVIKEYKVYKFSELSDTAKEKVREQYLEWQDAETFTDDCEYYLKELFPNSKLKVQYSLNSCQGDGLNIYGTINLYDMYYQIIKKKPQLFTEKECKCIEWSLRNYSSDVELAKNNQYCYCIAYRNDFTENLIDDMEYDNIRDINYKVLDKFNDVARTILTDLCNELEDLGYEYFYKVDDDILSDWIEINEYEFEEDGSIF